MIDDTQATVLLIGDKLVSSSGLKEFIQVLWSCDVTRVRRMIDIVIQTSRKNCSRQRKYWTKKSENQLDVKSTNDFA